MKKTHPQHMLVLCLVFGLMLLPFLTGATTRYVDINSTNPMVPYVSWVTAATNIQSAVNVAQAGDLILVNDGVYQVGTLNNQGPYGLEANRVFVNRAVAVRSVNGPEATLIVGSTNASSRVRCLYLVDGASLTGFTLTNGAAQYGAGGVQCASVSGVVSNCIIVGILGGAAQSGSIYDCVIRENISNTSSGSFGLGAFNSRLSGCLIISNYSSYRGGGAGSSYLTNCAIMDNYAGSFGGGIDGCTAINCTIVGNTARESGGGVSGGYVTNCIVYFNSIGYSNSKNTNHWNTSRLHNSCTTDIPASAINCFSTPPQFVNLATGNLHLQSNSPCIGAGFNVANLPSVDADGRPRVVDTTVDVGAYEYQGAAMEGYISWLASAGLPTHVTSDTADLDQDGASSWEEWRADTVPTNGASVLRMAAPTAGPVGLDITWQSVATRNYWLERAEYLEGAPAFQTIATNLHGVAGTVSYSDTQATNGWPYFYRVGVY